MNSFKYLQYRECLKFLVRKTKSITPEFTLARLCKRASIQPSFYSNVMSGRYDFNSDQLYGILENLQCSEAERGYALRLLEFERSQHPQRRKEMRAQILKIRKKNLKTHSQIGIPATQTSAPDLTTYYLDPTLQIIHVALSIPNYGSNPFALADRLKISKEAMEHALKKLSELKLIEFQTESKSPRWQLTETLLHLPEDSPLTLANQIGMRLKTLERIRERPSPRSVSVTFATSREKSAEIQSILIDALARIRHCVSLGEPEVLCQLNLDLFSWDE